MIAPDAFVAPGAILVGHVEVGAEASIWFGAVLRADNGRVVIGRGSAILDGALLHTPEGGEVLIEESVTIGHGAVLEGCVIGRGSLVGMNAVVARDARIGEGCVVAAGAVVGEGVQVPAGTLVAGVPAQVKKEVSGNSLDRSTRAAAHYRGMAREYIEEG